MVYLTPTAAFNFNSSVFYPAVVFTCLGLQLLGFGLVWWIERKNLAVVNWRNVQTRLCLPQFDESRPEGVVELLATDSNGNEGEIEMSSTKAYASLDQRKDAIVTRIQEVEALDVEQLNAS